jgi:signal transduction histidine kinase
MSPARSHRRRALLLVGLIWLLACGGLGWATRSAIALEELETQAEVRSAEERARALALSRLDGLVEPVLGRERVRPYEHYRRFFVLAKPLDARDLSPARHAMAHESPLRRGPGADWILLHFMASETEGWSSPQVEPGAEVALSAAAFSSQARAALGRPENWLAALRERYSPEALQAMLEGSLAADFENRQAWIGRGGAGANGGAVPPAAAAVGAGREAEFARRGERLLRLQRELLPLDRCEPEMVALANLEARGDLTVSPAGQECIQVLAGLMMPVWMDLTPDDEPHLAFVRSAHVETSHMCTLQGFLIDWPRLRSTLEAEISDLFPRARLVPVREPVAPGGQAALATLQTIPARLEPGPAAAGGGTTGAGWMSGGLALAWLTTLLALSAISYGTLKYVGMTERRMQFVAAVTHELRTPLTSFQLFSDLLADMPEENGERRHHYAEALRGESRRLSRLVENVLAYSRIGDAHPTLVLDEFQPQALLEAISAQTAEGCAAAGKRLVVENRCPPGQRLRTDREVVIQILSNLVENACKYSTVAEPSIWVSAAPGPGGGVVFEVEDAGPGVAPRDRRAVFEPFRRSESARAGGAGGVGLGLAMSRHWADCLGGRLTLHRGHRNGAGWCCFALSLPASART